VIGWRWKKAEMAPPSFPSFLLFSSSLLDISLPPIVSCCIILFLSPGFNLFLYFVFSFFSFFHFFGEQTCRIGDGLSCLWVLEVKGAGRMEVIPGVLYRFVFCFCTAALLGTLRFCIQSKILAIWLVRNRICLTSRVFSQSLYPLICVQISQLFSVVNGIG